MELICLKCLEKKPADRFTSAGELADELRAFVAGEPLRVPPPKATELTRKWLARRVGNAAWIPVIAITIGLISGFAIWVGTVGVGRIPTKQIQKRRDLWGYVAKVGELSFLMLML